MSATNVVRVTDLSNEEFLNTYAGPGRVGFSGGSTLIDLAIRAAERRLDEDRNWSQWSHVFVFQGRRMDTHHWIMESDIQLIRKHISLGVQENHSRKYHDGELYQRLAVLDFGLTEEQARRLLTRGLELIATKTRYSIRELLGAWKALRHPAMRGEENRHSRHNSLYCSAFVQHLFRAIDLEFAPGVTDKNTTPEDIFRTAIPHTTYVLERPRQRSKLARVAVRLHERIQKRRQSREQK